MDTRLIFFVIDPILISLQLYTLYNIYVYGIIRRSSYYWLYYSVGFNNVIHAITQLYVDIAMFFRFVDKSTILAQFALYLQFSGYVAIGIGTILMSLSRVTLVWAPIRTRFLNLDIKLSLSLSRVTLVWAPARTRFLWTANVMRILVFTQNFIAYAHALPCFFAQISFLPMGQEKFIAFPTSTALAMKLCACVSAILVLLISCPSTIISIHLLRLNKSFPRVERLLAYSTAILLLVFSVSCVDQVFVYLGRLFPASGLATLGLTMMHYSMDIHLFFTTFSPWLIHRTLRTKALGWSIGKASQTDVGHPQAIRTVTQHPQQRTINIDERNSRNTLPKLSIQTSFPNFISKKPDD